MAKCPDCKKEFSEPKLDFKIGREDTGNKFHYAICSCPSCDICLGFTKV